MNKGEFTRAYADKLGVTIKEADEYVNQFIETLTECLNNGEYVHISGFCTFSLASKNAREGVNPLTGDKIYIPECKAPTAKFSKTFKGYFNK